ncbi:hypothetical protein Anapl_09266 [Anas platyrhynchos]|uniref:Uncharacterized protein n=1 Tax=Anas platyrhynchos TaxID=8839 RepID=R0LFV5_ANAPL|nr:hypothetical protein Anapl_09266 [Anas platyrhynchos]
MHTQAGFSHTQKAALKPREKLRHWCSSPPSWGKYSSPPARTLHRQIGFFPFDIRCLKAAAARYHQTLSSVPVVGGVNDPLAAVLEASMMSSPVSREGKQRVIADRLITQSRTPFNKTQQLKRGVCRWPLVGTVNTVALSSRSSRWAACAELRIEEVPPKIHLAVPGKLCQSPRTGALADTTTHPNMLLVQQHPAQWWSMDGGEYSSPTHHFCMLTSPISRARQKRGARVAEARLPEMPYTIRACLQSLWVLAVLFFSDLPGERFLSEVSMTEASTSCPPTSRPVDVKESINTYKLRKNHLHLKEWLTTVTHFFTGTKSRHLTAGHRGKVTCCHPRQRSSGSGGSERKLRVFIFKIRLLAITAAAAGTVTPAPRHASPLPSVLGVAFCGTTLVMHPNVHEQVCHQIQNILPPLYPTFPPRKPPAETLLESKTSAVRPPLKPEHQLQRFGDIKNDVYNVITAFPQREWHCIFIATISTAAPGRGAGIAVKLVKKPQRWAGTGWRWSGKVSLSPGGPPNQRGEGLAAPLSIPSPVPCPWQARCHQVNMGWIHQPHCWLNPLAYKLYKGFPSRLLPQRGGRQVEEKTDLRGVSAGVFLPSQPPLGISWCTGGISELISGGSTTTTCLSQPDAPAQPCDFVPRLDNGEWRTLEKTLHQLVREINARCKCGAGGSRLKAHFQAHGGGSQKELSFLRPRSLFYPERVKPDLFFLPAEDEEDEIAAVMSCGRGGGGGKVLAARPALQRGFSEDGVVVEETHGELKDMCDQFSAGGSLAGLLHTQKPCAIGIFSSSAGGNPVLHNAGCRLRGTEGLEQPPGDARTTSTPKPHHLEAHGGSTRESHQSGCHESPSSLDAAPWTSPPDAWQCPMSFFTRGVARSIPLTCQSPSAPHGASLGHAKAPQHQISFSTISNASVGAGRSPPAPSVPPQKSFPAFRFAATHSRDDQTHKHIFWACTLEDFLQLDSKTESMLKAYILSPPDLTVNYCYEAQLAGGSTRQVRFPLELNFRKRKNSEYALHQD